MRSKNYRFCSIRDPHPLVGELPFPSGQLREAGIEGIQKMIREIEPDKPSTKIASVGERASEWARTRRLSVGALRKDLRGDLDWIVMMALAKEPERRYESATSFAQDLHRYLEHEPVSAGPPGVGYRLSKMLRKYRGQVAAGVLVLLVLIAGIITSLLFYLRSEAARLDAVKQAGIATAAQEKAVASEARAIEQKGIATAKTLEAERERERAEAKATEARRENDRFNRLSVMVKLDRVEVALESLQPAWPNKTEALEQWLREEGQPLAEELPLVQQTLRELEGTALPQTEDEQRAERLNHPKHAALQQLEKKVASLQAAMDVRLDKTTRVAVALPQDAPTTADALNNIAWKRVTYEYDERRWGEEAVALALARRAVAIAKDKREMYLDALAWACFANGLDAEATTQSSAALAAVPADDKAKKTEYRGYQDKLQQMIGAASKVLATAKTALSELSSELDARQTWRFAEVADGFLHSTLQVAEARLKVYRSAKGALVELRGRLDWSRKIGGLTTGHPKAQVTWAAAADAISKADGVVASELYSVKYHPAHAKRLLPETGLVPIGMNPKTKLWEFYNLRSAWDGKSDPGEIEIPVHSDDGSIEVTGSTGIVFVLLPGGKFWLGAQKEDPKKPNFDAGAHGDESPVRELVLAPFFLARHELTKGQWKRLSGGEEPSWFEIGGTHDGAPEAIGYAHPVEQVDWAMCDGLLRGAGLSLPTEAQWEYGCRGGSSTPWWPGNKASDLAGCANVLDRSAERVHPEWSRQVGDFDDGRVPPAPVGKYRPNRFGLYDVHGNVWEWCLDASSDYGGPVRLGDGLQHALLSADSSSDRANRGGSFGNPAAFARSADRDRNAPTIRSSDLGLRPARTSRLSH